jgi:hypothetical protein
LQKNINVEQLLQKYGFLDNLFRVCSFSNY